MSEPAAPLPNVTDVAREFFEQELGKFFAEFPDWSRTALLISAGMDQQLIRRIVEDGKPFQTGSADRLLDKMDDIRARKLVPPHIAKEKAANGGDSAKGRRRQ